MSEKSLQGKVAVIIGGAGGIGRSITALFLLRGAVVIVAYEEDSPEDQKSYFENLPKEYGSNVTPVPFNVASDVSVFEKALGDAKKHLTKLDILVINSSEPNSADPKIHRNNIEQFTRALKGNVHGAFQGAKLAAHFMKEGVILFTSGHALLTTEACPHAYAYAMSKHDLLGLAYNWSAELRKENKIRVSYIFPAPSPKKAEGTKKKKAAEGTIGACGNLKELVVEAENVAEEALKLSSGDETPHVTAHARTIVPSVKIIRTKD